MIFKVKFTVRGIPALYDDARTRPMHCIIEAKSFEDARTRIIAEEEKRAGCRVEFLTIEHIEGYVMWK